MEVGWNRDGCWTKPQWMSNGHWTELRQIKMSLVLEQNVPEWNYNYDNDERRLHQRCYRVIRVNELCGDGMEKSATSTTMVCRKEKKILLSLFSLYFLLHLQPLYNSYGFVFCKAQSHDQQQQQQQR
jgi:hypothetical protein